MRDHQLGKYLLLLMALSLLLFFLLSFSMLILVLLSLCFRHFGHFDSSVVFVNAVIGEAQIHGHPFVLFCSFLYLQKAFPHIRKC